MIVGRGLQGLGGGVFPLCFGIVRDEFPKHKVPTGIALLGAIAAVGSSIGLPLGGLLTDGPGYHSIFVVAAIMGVLATATTLLFVPRSPIRTPGRVDIRGAAVLGIALTALLLAISRGASLLGVCVGHQLLFDVSHEMGTTPGLGLLRGEVRRFAGPLPVPQRRRMRPGRRIRRDSPP